MNVVLRKEAKERGLYKYFTGEPCSHGHMAERYVANGHCVICQSTKSKTAEARYKQAERRTKSSDYQREYHKAWSAKNRTARLEYMREYNKSVAVPRSRERYKTDPLTMASKRMRARLAAVLKAKKIGKTSNTKEFVGCDFAHLVSHIESRFKPGMSWENRGMWHIDHIIPLCLASDEKQLRKLFHYTNLQPLWAVDNLRKGKRMDDITMVADAARVKRELKQHGIGSEVVRPAL